MPLHGRIAMLVDERSNCEFESESVRKIDSGFRNEDWIMHERGGINY
jgi:hypothetical protein